LPKKQKRKQFPYKKKQKHTPYCNINGSTRLPFRVIGNTGESTTGSRLGNSIMTKCALLASL